MIQARSLCTPETGKQQQMLILRLLGGGMLLPEPITLQPR